MKVQLNSNKHEVGLCYKEPDDPDIFIVIYDKYDDINKYKFVNLMSGFVTAKYSSMDELDNYNETDILVDAKMVIS